jgi:hypothetical protein
LLGGVVTTTPALVATLLPVPSLAVTLNVFVDPGDKWRMSTDSVLGGVVNQ